LTDVGRVAPVVFLAGADSSLIRRHASNHRSLPSMIDFSQNYFALFGLAPRYRVSEHEIDAAFRELQSSVHPDRYVNADESARRESMQSSAQVNEAYRSLRDPVGRAEYLLRLHGVDTMIETDNALPLDFLEEQMERRESVDDARRAGAVETLDRLAHEIRRDIASREAALATTLDERQAWDAARPMVRELRFLQKLATDIDASIAEIEG